MNLEEEICRFYLIIVNLTLVIAFTGPHFTTLDRQKFTYSGSGEYYLLQTDDGNEIIAQVTFFK